MKLFHPSDLTDEFLSTLLEVARTIGHGAGDYHETIAFVQEVFFLAGKDVPDSKDLAPYPAIDNVSFATMKGCSG
jgi:hypothetical protein